ncbi:MAG TPA: SpoIVB peptidase S55 domain-containing protein [Candidatus Polarisedimenticolaceae bacterium]|nr:SpoIVB peptidase S55 domain-containing protein [Candidatus Polarisedimenticolaceae bacterium]
MNLRRALLLAVLALPLLAAPGPASAASVPILTFEEVAPGMKGTGRTVFQGTKIESFDVEILGKLPNIGPDQNLILARCSGGPLATTGVLAGMSGSPVFVDGRLVGAVAYSWGFTKDAIAGITPIEEMLAVAARNETPARSRAAGLPLDALSWLRHGDRLASFFQGRLLSLAARPAAASPTLPLAVSGLGSAGFARVASDLERAGFVPLQAGGAGRAPSPAPALEPGSAVGVKLVRGDVDMTATGTVTWVDGDRVLAFGHPLYSLGAVDLPLTGARVEALLPSLLQSMRIATPLEEIGSFRQDRATAIFGRLGGSPKMIPVRLQLGSRLESPKTFSFDVADDPLLAPVLLYVAMNGVLANQERVVGSMTLNVREGSVIRLEGQNEVELSNVFAGSTAPYYATGTSAFILHLLMNNDWKAPRITGINLILEHDDEPRTARVQRVTLDRYRVHPGESVRVSVVISPFRGPEQTLVEEVPIPAETAPGRLLLHVGNGLEVMDAEGVDDSVRPRDLDQLIQLINSIRRNDRVHLVALAEDSGAFLRGARLPNLPPSVAGVLTRPRGAAGGDTRLRYRGVLQDEIPTDYAVEGLVRVALEVESR